MAMSSLDVFFILQGIIPRSLTQFCLDLANVGIVSCHACHAGLPPLEMTEKQHPWRRISSIGLDGKTWSLVAGVVGDVAK